MPVTGQEVGAMPHVKVGWAADRHVQVGVEADGERSLNWMLYGSDPVLTFIGERVYEEVEAHRATSNGPGLNIFHIDLGRIVLNVLDTVPGATTEQGYQGVWADMDREGCNRLVRLVRKARDSAFGADA